MPYDTTSAVIICRVSTREQKDDGYSLVAQEQLLLEHCARHGLTVVDRLSFAETASKYDQRKKFHGFLKTVRKTGIRHIVVEKVDRLTRSGSRDAVLVDEWIEEDESRHVHFVKQSLDVHKYAPATVKFVWSMHVAVAKHGTDNLSEEVRKTTDVMLKMGIWPSGYKIGYVRVKTVEGSSLEQNPETAPIISKLFGLYDSGMWSIERLTHAAYAYGLRSRNGRKLPLSRIHCILKDPFYMGQMLYSNKLWQGSHKPLVSPETFASVQKRMRKKYKGRGASMRRSHEHLMGGLAHCAGCGRRITWELHGDNTYGYCKGYKDCTDRLTRREDWIEGHVASQIEGLKIVLEKMADWTTRALRVEDAEVEGNLFRRRKAFEDDITLLTRKFERLLELRISNELSLEEFKSKKTEVEEQRLFVQSQLQAVGTELDKHMRSKADTYETARQIALLYRSGEPATRRGYLLELVESVSAGNELVSVQFKTPYDRLAEAVKITNSSKVPKNFDFKKCDFRKSEKWLPQTEKPTFYGRSFCLAGRVGGV